MDGWTANVCKRFSKRICLAPSIWTSCARCCSNCCSRRKILPIPVVLWCCWAYFYRHFNCFSSGRYYLTFIKNSISLSDLPVFWTSGGAIEHFMFWNSLGWHSSFAYTRFHCWHTIYFRLWISLCYCWYFLFLCIFAWSHCCWEHCRQIWVSRFP